ncbi:YolD-like family protein [Gracilibacillus dipsosauri]|uniref:YolD-like family protein n=2 Tax=Gracilibacillus dipsosauri TaxID=178340 RepID=A0A317KYT3_9BACI|nr:YolD-like family protein [Gracilibacillus dipsosauri]
MKNVCLCIIELEVMIMVNDRGHKKWASLMLPEHVIMLEQLEKEDNLVNKPLLESDILEEMEHQIQQAILNKTKLTIDYYQNRRIHSIQGTIDTVKPYTAQITIVLDSSKKKKHLSIRDIVAIK